MEHTPHQRRGQPHTKRRGSERRGSPDRRSHHAQPAEQVDRVDVDGIMRELRGRIAQQGIELSPQQIQDLAARRLEAILDPRTVNAPLLAEMRRAAGVPEPSGSATPTERPAPIDVEAMLAPPGGVIGALRALLRPLLTLIFDPRPLVGVMADQQKALVAAEAREAAREARQREWNALHYDILQRLVTEVARVSLENESLALRVESLSAKVDFNERRVRGVEGALPARPGGRHNERAGGERQAERHAERQAEPRQTEPRQAVDRQAERQGEPRPSVVPDASAAIPVEATPADGALDTTDEVARRRRRRRRGRRSSGAGDRAGGGVLDAAGTEPGLSGDTEEPGVDAPLDAWPASAPGQDALPAHAPGQHTLPSAEAAPASEPAHVSEPIPERATTERSDGGGVAQPAPAPVEPREP
ncbi:MAG: hypothetical protein AB7G23_18085 [Vicinamibacterales bacterium]